MTSEVMNAGELKFVVKEIPANLLTVDPEVQRGVTESRVNKIVERFSEGSLGILKVSERQPGVYAVLDGQTRLAAIRRLAGDEATVYPLMCQVYLNLHRKEEARLFLESNDRTAVSSLDKFRLSLVAEEPWAQDINGLAEKHGYTISLSHGPRGRFTAVRVAERIYRMNGGREALDRALGTIASTWGQTPLAASAEAVAGLGLLYQRHPDKVHHVGLTKKLAEAGSPSRFVGAVSDMRAATGVTKSEAAYRYVVRVHDKNMKSNRIDQ